MPRCCFASGHIVIDYHVGTRRAALMAKKAKSNNAARGVSTLFYSGSQLVSLWKMVAGMMACASRFVS